ncbi:MAG: general secretion pathway protein GspB [Pseudomonadota bacterium]
MSFILDALKKSETDRQRQFAPALFEVKVAAPRRRFPLWSIAVGALLAVNIAFLVWYGFRDPAAPAAPPTSAVAPVAVAPAAATPPGMVTVPATATYIPANAAPNLAQGAINPDAGVVAPSQAPPLAEEPVLSGQQPSVPPDYDARDYAPAITPAQANATAAARRSGSLPSRDEVLAQGTQLPELRLDLHVYDADPAKRFVFINMRRLREGESLPEGVRVDAITQNGARLSYRGTSFTLEQN